MVGREPSNRRALASRLGVGAGACQGGVTLPLEGPGEGGGWWVEGSAQCQPLCGGDVDLWVIGTELYRRWEA